MTQSLFDIIVLAVGGHCGSYGGEGFPDIMSANKDWDTMCYKEYNGTPSTTCYEPTAVLHTAMASVSSGVLMNTGMLFSMNYFLVIMNIHH